MPYPTESRFITRLFSSDPMENRKEWPFQNHRAEFTAKLIEVSVNSVVYLLSALDDTSRKLLAARFKGLLTSAYQDLRRKDPEHNDPTLEELIAYATQVATSRISSISRSGTAHSVIEHDFQKLNELDLYEAIIELIYYVQVQMETYAPLSILLQIQQPGVLHTASILNNQTSSFINQ